MRIVHKLETTNQCTVACSLKVEINSVNYKTINLLPE